ncbi:hypothetical protein Y032_0007g3244 [Ancylostoma ceylanicum]|uniref:C2H2-type domain-containing protein n=1 Tax=Ancylostoma ceylanicum TaxID=53326 RepID=A0A016VN88_9BILA|nr:hypothetical protein Y032_0007g3244 [Ancylostoma ceylanicum]
MLPRRASILRANSDDGDSVIQNRVQFPKFTWVRADYAANKFSPVTRQLAPNQKKFITHSATISAPSTAYTRVNVARPRIVDEVTNTKASCSSGSVRPPIVKAEPSGRYLLRIPKNEPDAENAARIQLNGQKVNDRYSLPFQKRVVIPTVPPSMSMGGEYPADQYELVYESDSASSLVCLAEQDDSGYSRTEDRKRFFCSEMTCFWHGPTHASLRRHMMVTHSRNTHPEVHGLAAQSIRRSTKPKGVKCSECGQMAYSRPLLLRHMTQAHGIVAPLIYKTFSDRENLQNWLEQLRETHAVEFVVSSGSKKWGQGLQVHYLTCSRSGEQKERPNKKFRRPTRPSIKCGKNCMAYLKMKQNPTVSELKIEACLHHSGHEIDASKIRLEQNEWYRLIQLIRVFIFLAYHFFFFCSGAD